MKLLSEAFKPIDEGLAELYRSLLASEARHHSLYIDLALDFAPQAEVMSRLQELAIHESEILQERGPELRMHS